MKKQINGRKQNGFSILEVVIGIFIFIVGLLAMAALQGSLTRSMVDSKLRTTAVNIADQFIERQRGFTLIISDPDGVIHAYNDIEGSATSEVVNGVTYDVAMGVTDYYYQLSVDGFCMGGEGCPTDMPASAYKQVTVTVSWNSGLDFRGDEGDVVAAASLGTGSITLTSVIPAIVTSASARVAETTTGGAGAYPVTYSRDPDSKIVPLALGGAKYKESTYLRPDVLRKDGEQVETRFDVITYGQGTSGNLFLRREEFATVSCKCTFNNENNGRRPVIWAGDEYLRGQFVQKPSGDSADINQSSLCIICCRDHHDGGTEYDTASITDHADGSVNVYGPFRGSTEYIGGTVGGSDHEHYDSSDLTLAVTSGPYVEACRLVRQDGFFRVTQDFRREDLHVFPEDFLDQPVDEPLEVAAYSSHVTESVVAYAFEVKNPSESYTSAPPCIGVDPCTISPAPKQGAYSDAIDLSDGEIPSWTTLPLDSNVTQQLTSRGIYIDYLSFDLRTVLACLGTWEEGDDICKSGDVELNRSNSDNPLVLIPFFDVQMEKLNRWNEAPANLYVDTTNEDVVDYDPEVLVGDPNDYSRGVISKVADGESTVVAYGHRGNLGFTDSSPIDPEYYSQVTSSSIFVHAPASTPTILEGTAILGSLTGLIGDIDVEGLGGVLCGHGPEPEIEHYGCTVLTTAINPQIRLSGYGNSNSNKPRYACSRDWVLTGPPIDFEGEDASAVFNLTDVPAGTTYDFVIQDTPCPIDGGGGGL